MILSDKFDINVCLNFSVRYVVINYAFFKIQIGISAFLKPHLTSYSPDFFRKLHYQNFERFKCDSKKVCYTGHNSNSIKKYCL